MSNSKNEVSEDFKGSFGGNFGYDDYEVKRNDEIEKYKDVKRDLAFICQMVRENKRAMLSQIMKELIVDENMKYIPNTEFIRHDIQTAYTIYYKKTLKEGISSDPLVEMLEKFKETILCSFKSRMNLDDVKSVNLNPFEKIAEIVPELLTLDSEFCAVIFIRLYSRRKEPEFDQNLMIYCLKNASQYEEKINTNLISILDDKDILDLIKVIAQTEHHFRLWLLEIKKRSLGNFIDVVDNQDKISFLSQLLMIIRTEEFHDSFISAGYNELIKNRTIILNDHELCRFFRKSLDRGFTLFAETYLDGVESSRTISFSAPFTHTLYELAYHRKNENILKRCVPPKHFEKNKWKLGFLDLNGDINLKIKKTSKERIIEYNTNSEYSFELIDIVDNVARFSFAVVTSGFVTLCASMGSISIPSNVTTIKVQNIQISQAKLSFFNCNENKRLSNSVFLLKTDKDQSEMVYFGCKFHTIKTTKDSMDLIHDEGYSLICFPWGGGGGCFGAKILDKPNDLKIIIPELQNKFNCYEVKMNSELDGRIWAMNRCGARNHGGTVWLLFNEDFSSVQLGEDIFSHQYKFPIICDKLEEQNGKIYLDLRVDPDSIIGNDKTPIVYHKIINC